jgi:hypothetical protein
MLTAVIDSSTRASLGPRRSPGVARRAGAPRPRRGPALRALAATLACAVYAAFGFACVADRVGLGSGAAGPVPATPDAGRTEDAGGPAPGDDAGDAGLDPGAPDLGGSDASGTDDVGSPDAGGADAGAGDLGTATGTDAGPPCGGRCTAAETCVAGACLRCGGSLQPCCDGDRCSDGFACVLGVGCTACGGSLQPCCKGAVPCRDLRRCTGGLCL